MSNKLRSKFKTIKNVQTFEEEKNSVKKNLETVDTELIIKYDSQVLKERQSAQIMLKGRRNSGKTKYSTIGQLCFINRPQQK